MQGMQNGKVQRHETSSERSRVLCEDMVSSNSEYTTQLINSTHTHAHSHLHFATTHFFTISPFKEVSKNNTVEEIVPIPIV